MLMSGREFNRHLVLTVLCHRSTIPRRECLAQGSQLKPNALLCSDYSMVPNKPLKASLVSRKRLYNALALACTNQRNRLSPLPAEGED